MTGIEIKVYFQKHKTKVIFSLIMLLGIMARVIQFGVIPGDINQDEAFAGYEAYSLLHYGMDSSGYRFPVYFVSWGSGMNVLNSMLMIPFIAVFGLKTWVIRLPQLFTAILTLPAVYGIVREKGDDRQALWCMFFLAVAPWHIMLSRWGLESNLAPGFLIFGLYFFLKGLRRSQFYLLSALMYGLSLYAYATIWPVVPFLLLLMFLGCISTGRGNFKNRNFICSVILLFLLALPLILFLLVNRGLIEEIRLPFLSIPKLVYMRASEISIHNIPENLRNFVDIFLHQSDGLSWNAVAGYGIFYVFSFPLFLVGLFFLFRDTIQDVKKRLFTLNGILLIHLFTAMALGLLVSVNINRINCLWIPVILIAGLGIYRLSTLKMQVMLPAFALLYLFCFARFEYYYFTEYEQTIMGSFSYGIENAMAAVTAHEGTIYISKSVQYPRVLFYSEEDVREYTETVQCTNYPSAFLDVAGFGRYSFEFDLTKPDEEGIYLLDSGANTAILEEKGFTIRDSGIYRVAWME